MINPTILLDKMLKAKRFNDIGGWVDGCVDGWMDGWMLIKRSSLL